MGDELEREFDAAVTIVPSSGGVFEVRVDNELLFSKKSLNRFPEEGEVVNLLRAARPS